MLNARLAAAVRTAASLCKSVVTKTVVKSCLGEELCTSGTGFSSVRASMVFENAFASIRRVVRMTGLGREAISEAACDKNNKMGLCVFVLRGVPKDADAHQLDMVLSNSPTLHKSIKGNNCSCGRALTSAMVTFTHSSQSFVVVAAEGAGAFRFVSNTVFKNGIADPESTFFTPSFSTFPKVSLEIPSTKENSFDWTVSREGT